MATTEQYSNWDKDALIDRVSHLEERLRVQNKILNQGRQQQSQSPARTPTATSKHKQKQKDDTRTKRHFDPFKYNTRYIALRLSYLGHAYSGFEHHANSGPRLPAIEEELWKALAKVKLILPTNGTDGEVDWEGCEYSKCGRTDRGVSAFGQVIALRVRSSRPLKDVKEVVVVDDDGTERTEYQKICWDPVKDELAYTRMLNRVLPPDIRIHAWCPAPTPDFSARFSCKERRYRYFFTQPAFAPRPGRAGLNSRGQRDGWLDLDGMRMAAKYFEGLHDFRNFCKVDPSKQITNFQRRIFEAEIRVAASSTDMPGSLKRDEFSPVLDQPAGGIGTSPTVLEFRVSGSGFLWHQVRHMVAVLFLVGQGLQKPEIVRDLLEVEKQPQKPHYEMADDAPLVLWECIFPSETGDQHEDALDWIYPEDQVEVGHGAVLADGRYGPNGLNETLWSEWRQRKIDEVLAGSLFDVVGAQGQNRSRHSHKLPATQTNGDSSHHDLKAQSTQLFDGGNSGIYRGEYTSLLRRDRHMSVEEQNRRYRIRKGITAEGDIVVTPDS